MNEGASVPTTMYARRLKRAVDVLGASLLVLVGAPLLLACAVLIRATSRGPALFVQERAGCDGRIFRLFKFRTMRADRRPDVKELVPLEHPDITPIGRILRRFKLDELPQVFNVLLGDMSIVGPRPTLPDQAARYTAFQRQRLLLRPGLTGLAQVYSSASRTWNERILYDVAYVRRCSLRLDLHILLRTPLTMLLGEERTAQSFGTSPFAAYVTPPPPEDCPDPVHG